MMLVVNMTGWFRDEILSPILQFRLASGLPVLISSNFSQKELIGFMALIGKKLTALKPLESFTELELTDEVPLTTPFGK